MKITLKSDNGKRHYHIALEKHEFDDLCADCPGIPALVGIEENSRAFFYLYPGRKMADAFKETPGRDGYFAYLGAEVPRLPPNPTNEEFERLSKIAYSNLEKAINSASIPIEISGTAGPINVGYVTMSVKK